MAALAHAAPLHWPEGDALLPSFQADPQLVEVISPVTFTSSEYDSKISAEGGRNYVRVCPKFEVHAFHQVAWTPQDGPLHLLGAVYFSKATAGSPGCVAGGALTTALDAISGDMAMRGAGWEIIYVTRSLSVRYVRAVPVDSVCRFDCRAEVGERECVTHCSLSIGSLVLTECSCVFVGKGPLPSSLVVRSRAPASPPPLAMEVPADDEGWWPATARELAARLVREDPKLQPAVDHVRHFPEKCVADAAQTLWDTSASSSSFWDVSRKGVALQALSGSAPKVVWQIFWRSSEGCDPSVVGVVIFTANAEGPPGGAHGGAAATVLDWGMAMACTRQLGFLPAWNNVNLNIRYRRPTPLGEPVLLAARVTKSEGRRAQAEAVLLPAAAWPSRSERLWADCKGVLVQGSSDCVQARPSSVGLEKAISYEEAIERFGGAGSLAALLRAQAQRWMAKL